MRVFLLSLLLLAFSTALQATDQAAIWAEALRAQQDGQPERAIALYQDLLAQGQTAPELHNNLGLAYYQQGELGEAILHFNRALRLAPNYEAARHHLAAAQQRIARPVEASESIALVRLWQGLYRALPSGGWALVLFLLLSASAAGVIYILVKGKAWREATTPLIGSLGLFGLALFVLLLGSLQYAEETASNAAVVTAPQAGLRAHPELSSPELDVLSEGISLRIVDQQQDWVQVELPNYVVGWMPASLIETI